MIAEDKDITLYLEIIERFGSYVDGVPHTIIDPADLAVLDELELVRPRWGSLPSSTVLVYQLSDRGRLWLKGCRRVDPGLNERKAQ